MLYLSKKISIWVAVLSLPCLLAAQTAVFYVDPAFQGESPTGDSWLSAFKSLQTAIDSAADQGGGDVWVKAGVHQPAGASRNATFKMKPGVAIYGGFRGTETARDQRNPKGSRTVLSGDIGRMGSTSDNVYHIITGSDNSRIDGFILSRGNANAAGENRFGGAILLPAGAENVTIENCTFEKNNAEEGGAIYAAGAAFVLTNCTFYSNSAEAGGAITLATGSKMSAFDCSFSASFAPKNGGAVYMQSGTEGSYERCMFNYNSTDGRGGALFAESTDKGGIRVSIHEGIFRENSAKLNGGALAFKGGFIPMVLNSTFSRNRSAKGAGAIGNESGISAIITGGTFDKNTGIKGSEDVASDDASRVVESEAEAAKLAEAARVEQQQQAQIKRVKVPVVKEAPKRQLADVYVYNDKGIKVKLRSIVADAAQTVIAMGDLTDPRFLSSYRNIEAAARDYYPRDVRFYYLYKHLAHPENHRYIKPFKMQERARHSTIAKALMETQLPWLYDVMDNETAEALSADGSRNLFVFSADGTEMLASTMDDEPGLRKILTDLAGPTEIPTQAAALPNPDLPPVHPVEEQSAARMKVPVSARFQPLEITPLDSKSPHYVKLRVEGNAAVLSSGDGQLYLGFHIDPLYQVAWNNLGDPMKYAIKVPSGVVAPSINSAERVDVATDAEPREFLIETRKLDRSKPFTIQVDYSVHSLTSRKNIDVSQQYMVYLQPDKFGGQVIGRQISSAKNIGKTRPSKLGNAYTQMLRRLDLDRNGRISSDEAIGNLQRNFNEIDTDKDGFVEQDEYFHYRENRP